MAETINNEKHVHHSKRRTLLTWLTIIFLVLGFLYLIYWLIWGRFEVYTDDAYVNGNMVQLMPQVAGTVITISTDDTRLVLRGQSLIKLDGADAKVAYRQAHANLAQTVRQVKQYFENVSELEASLSVRAADLEKAKLDLRRRMGLSGLDAVSREELQHIKTSLAAAQAQYNLSLHQLNAAKALVANTTVYTHPLVKQAEARFQRAYLNLVRTNIDAPITGIVAKRSVQIGQQVTPGTTLLSIVPLEQVWVDANYKESQLRNIRIGQPARVEVDANGLVYHGKVLGLSPGTGSAFSILPPQNATGNWIKIVQRLPVRIMLDAEELKQHPLQLGLSTEVTIDTSDRSGHVLPQISNNTPLYQTSTYAAQLHASKNLIKQILETNLPLDKR